MRPMTAADVDEVLSIERSVQGYPWTRGNFSDALSSGYLCLVDDAAGELRSFAVLMSGVDEAELLNVGVASKHQRNGLGRTMLAAMLGAASEKKMQRVFLEVRASNWRAIALYRSAGFLEIGLRRGYYRNDIGCEDALVMAFDISSLPQAGERLGERENG